MAGLAPLEVERNGPGGPARISFDSVSFRYPTPAEVSLASLESIAVSDKTPEKTVLNKSSSGRRSQSPQFRIGFEF
jgi:hypothetical protein